MTIVGRMNRSRNSVGRINVRHEAAAAEGWWLSGGIDAANCIAAYQPKGAASYAASKSNLANPGTYDAIEGVAPAWDAVNGWMFDGVNNYLNTGVSPTAEGAYSMIARFSNATGINGNDTLAGMYATQPVNRFFMSPNYNGSQHIFGFGDTYVLSASQYSSGTIALTQDLGYINGFLENDLAATAASSVWISIYIGAFNREGAGASQYAQAYVQAFAIYNIVISAAQVSALTTAMNAL